MNFASLSIDYAFPDLTEKVGAVEDTSQGQEAPSAPSHLPKMSLVEPPWHVVPREEEDEEEVEEEEEEEEEEEQLLPVTTYQGEARTQAHTSPPTRSSQTAGTSEHRQDESVDQASSGVEVGSSLELSLSPPAVSQSPVTLGGQDVDGLGAGGAVLQAAGHGGELETIEEATPGATGLAGEPGEVPSVASFSQTEAPRGAEAPDRNPLPLGASASLPPAPEDMEPTLSSTPLGREGLSPQPQEGPAVETPSRTPWDSTQVRGRCEGLPLPWMALQALGDSGRCATQPCGGCPHCTYMQSK